MQVVGQMLDGVRDATANGRAKTATMAPVAVPVIPNGALADRVGGRSGILPDAGR
jgi:hypothetical protein